MSDDLHEALNLSPSERFRYAFRLGVLELPEAELSQLVGAVLQVALIDRHRVRGMAPEDLAGILRAAAPIVDILEPLLLTALQETTVGRFFLWHAQEEYSKKQEETDG